MEKFHLSKEGKIAPEKPENHGKPWAIEERKELKRQYDKGLSITELSKIYKRTEISIELTIRKEQIYKVLEQRKIRKLIHFTDKRNIKTIKKYGLLPITRLKEKNIRYYENDPQRLDNQWGGISISVTSRNSHLLRAYHERNPRAWVEIEIDPEVAATRNCLFYDSNAASKKYKNAKEEYLQSADALRNIFADSVTNSSGKVFTRRNKNLDEPTDGQAEIIVRWLIPKSKILSWKEINV